MVLYLPRWVHMFFFFLIIPCVLFVPQTLVFGSRPTPQQHHSDESLTYLWPLPTEFTSGDEVLSVDPSLTLSVAGNGGGSAIVRDAFERYRGIIFKHSGGGFVGFGLLRKLRESIISDYDVSQLKITVHSDNEEVP